MRISVVHIYVYAFGCERIYMSIDVAFMDVCMYIHVCVCLCVCLCMGVYDKIRDVAFMYVCACTYICVCVCVCVYISIKGGERNKLGQQILKTIK